MPKSQPLTLTVLLPLLTLLPLALAYSYKGSHLYSEQATRISLAPETISTQRGDLNVVIGMADGTVVVTNTEDFGVEVRVNLLGRPVVGLDWNQGGVFMASADRVRVWDPKTQQLKLALNFNQPILAASFSYNPPTLLTSLTFLTHIQLYTNSTPHAPRYTQQPPITAFSHTGKHLHYFDSSTRFIYDTEAAKIVNSYYADIVPTDIAVSGRMGFEDFVVSVDSRGWVRVWDYGGLRGSYEREHPQTMVDFASDSNYLVTYQPTNSTLTLWTPSFTSPTTWSITSQFTQPNITVSYSMDAKNNRIAYLSGNAVYVYREDEGLSWLAIVVVLALLFGGLCCLGVCCFCYELVKSKGALLRGDKKEVLVEEPEQEQGFNNNEVNNSGYNPPTQPTNTEQNPYTKILPDK